MKRFFCLLLAVVLTFGSFSGCGSNPSTKPTGGGLAPDDVIGPAVTEPKEETIQELTLTYYPEHSMNPFKSTDFTNRALFPLLYQSLFVVDRSGNVQPQLCSRYSVSEDMKRYTFYVENATFSDGSLLTIQDVLASYQAAADHDYYRGRFFHVFSMELSEDGGIVFTLTTAYENFPILLDIPIVPQDQVDMEHPLGTGPYVLEGSRLVRRTNWWCKADLVVTAPVIPLIEATSPNQIRDNFQFNDLDLVCADPGSDKYADYRCDYELWDCENGIFMYLACSVDSKVFSVPEIRAALTYAVDRDTISDTYYHGFARSASLPASPLSPYYSQSLASRYQFDPDRFAEAVSQAGMRNEEVEFLVNSDDSLRLRVARSIAQVLTDCGLKVTMKEVGGQNYLNCLYYRTFDIYLGQTKLSPNMDLSAFFFPTGALSYGGINDTGIYALCLESLANHGNYYTLHQTIMDSGALCPVLFRSYAVYATRGLLTNLTPSRDNIFYYSLRKTMEQALIRQ